MAKEKEYLRSGVKLNVFEISTLQVLLYYLLLLIHMRNTNGPNGIYLTFVANQPLN